MKTSLESIKYLRAQWHGQLTIMGVGRWGQGGLGPHGFWIY